MVGVLDYDSPAPMAEHDPIGRAEIDVTNLRPGTEYTLYYDLYTSAIVKKRKSKGSIKVRLRLELSNQRKTLISAVNPPPEVRSYICLAYNHTLYFPFVMLIPFLCFTDLRQRGYLQRLQSCSLC